jgi:phosphatidylserine decarboxylase
VLSIQKYLPKHLLTKFVGILANSKTLWIKNNLIKYFIKIYPVNMQEAEIEDPFAYKTFNQFFTRSIKQKLRPITTEANAIASPVDGSIYQLGYIKEHQFIAAKGQNFTVPDLLGPKINSDTFKTGAYINIYLSPINYHRVHIPITGTLMQMNYIPGKLFSVNNASTNYIPNLFAKNERVVAIFQTDFGTMAVILVGAMLVGNIETSWAGPINSTHAKQPLSITYNITTENAIKLNKGQELGLFKMGSTVIVLFANDKVKWLENINMQTKVQMGQQLGVFLK